jgi:CMP-N-acetylneuraminic acid synthetase
MIPLVILVRDGSTRCPGKLLRPFADGKSLFEICAEKFAGRPDVFVAAREEVFKKKARELGLQIFHRNELSVNSEDVRDIWNFLYGLPYKHACFINACCPLIKASTIDAAIDYFKKDQINPGFGPSSNSLTTVKKLHEIVFTPDHVRVEVDLSFNSKFREPFLVGTNSIIVFNVEKLRQTGGFWESNEDPLLYKISELEAHDIDTELDFIRAQAAWEYAKKHPESAS